VCESRGTAGRLLGKKHPGRTPQVFTAFLGVIAARRLPVEIRQRRDFATASKDFFFMAMDKEG